MTDVEALWDAPAPVRRPGVFMRTTYRLVPRVRRVRDQAGPYAEAWRESNRAALAREGRRWIVLGDSMSQGVGASAFDHGWVGIVAERLRADGQPLNVVNLSATGARTTEVRDRQLAAMASLPDGDPTAPPDLVTLMVGSNDLFGGRAARAELPAAMAAVVDALPDGAVVSALPQPAPAAQLANRPLDDAVKAGRLLMVDMRVQGPDSWRGLVASDFFHPNDAGYEVIADAVEPVVRAALGVHG